MARESLSTFLGFEDLGGMIEGVSEVTIKRLLLLLGLGIVKPRTFYVGLQTRGYTSNFCVDLGLLLTQKTHQ